MSSLVPVVVIVEADGYVQKASVYRKAKLICELDELIGVLTFLPSLFQSLMRIMRRCPRVNYVASLIGSM